jgi:chemotaxis protein MotB
LKEGHQKVIGKPLEGDIIMHNRSLFFVSCFILILSSACVPGNQHMAVKSELNAEIKQADEQIENLTAKLKSAETSKNKCLNDLKARQAQNAQLKNINLQLSKNLESLTTDLNKKKSVIKLQGKVIQLLDDTKKTIETSLKDQIASQDVEIVEMEDKLKVIFIDKILFNSGKVDINEQGKSLLIVVADSISGHENQNVVVEGHTDNVPISAGSKKKFPSNWELSTARAAAVVRFIQEEGGVPPERLSVRGYSFYRPVASNRTEEGRTQNRRIEITLGPQEK